MATQNISDFRTTFHGNKMLWIGTLGDSGVVTNPVHGAGLVSIGAMENQSEAESQYADDEVWISTMSAPVLQGDITFIQLNEDLRTDLFGQQVVSGKIGTVDVTGYADTGAYPQRAVQFVTEGKAVSINDGSIVDAAMVTFFPNVQVTSTPTKETTTDTDGIEVVNWGANIQATTTDKFLVEGKKLPAIEFTVIGNKEVADLKKALSEGTFFTQAAAAGASE